MKLSSDLTPSSFTTASLAIFVLFVFAYTAIAADNPLCPPANWTESSLSGLRQDASVALPLREPINSKFDDDDYQIQPGEINCRYTSITGSQVNYYTCKQLAIEDDITVEMFFFLNPEIHPDCGNIQPRTEYCVEGFIEPLRATDGLCGPKHNNATCVGMDAQCCNSETWKCGNSTEDCAPGTCYEGDCIGDKVYSTDGTCGPQFGNRLCAGKWGDCCNMSGKCGTGVSFCGKEVCRWGNCQRPVITPSLPPWLSTGNTTDGTCGGPKSMTCNVVYGNCCNKSGFCGSLPSDCGTGCQPKWGNCTSTTSVSSVSPTSTKPSTTSSSKISSTSSRTSTTSSSSTSTSCTGVALATPTSSGSLCGINATSIAMTGTGGLINYTSGPYVTDPQACAAICKKTATCTNFYFILNTACNLKYGPVSYVINNSGVNVYRLYTLSCFACSTCHSAAIAAPAPAGSLCNIQANGIALAGSGSLVSYTTGSPYTASIEACAAICMQTATCTNMLFISGKNCNLKFGPPAYVLNTSGVNAYSLFSLSCFTCIY